MVEESNPLEEVVEEKPDPITAVLARLEGLEGNIKNLERINSRKEEENKRLRDSIDRRDEEQTTLKAMMTLMASQTGQSEEELETDLQERRPNLAKQFDTLVSGERKKREQEKLAQAVTSYQQRTIELGLTEADKEYWAIYGAVGAGKYDKADKILDELTEAKKVVETPAEKPKKEDVEEAARKMLEERGQLRTETPAPSAVKGQMWTMEQVRKMESVDYAKHFPGGFPQIEQMVREGKIKV